MNSVEKFCFENDIVLEDLDECVIDAIEDGEQVHICQLCKQVFLEEDIKECPTCQRMICKNCFGNFYEEVECASCSDNFE